MFCSWLINKKLSILKCISTIATAIEFYICGLLRNVSHNYYDLITIVIVITNSISYRFQQASHLKNVADALLVQRKMFIKMYR